MCCHRKSLGACLAGSCEWRCFAECLFPGDGLGRVGFAHAFAERVGDARGEVVVGVEAHQSLGAGGGSPGGSFFDGSGDGVGEGLRVGDGAFPAEVEAGDHYAEPAEVGGDDGATGGDGAECDVAEADMGGVGDGDDLAGGEGGVEFLIGEVAVFVDEASIVDEVLGLITDDGADGVGGASAEEEAVVGVEFAGAVCFDEGADEPVDAFLRAECAGGGDETTVGREVEHRACGGHVHGLDGIDGVGEGGAALGERVIVFAEPLLGEDIDEEEAVDGRVAKSQEGEASREANAEVIVGVGEAAAVEGAFDGNGPGQSAGDGGDAHGLCDAVGGGNEDMIGLDVVDGLQEEPDFGAGVFEAGGLLLAGVVFMHAHGIDVGGDLVLIGLLLGGAGGEGEGGLDALDGLEREEDLSDVGEAVACGAGFEDEGAHVRDEP